MRPDGVCSEELLVALKELRPYALRLTGDRDQADELIQDTAERVLRHRHRFEPGTNLVAWMRTIMRRRFIDEARKRSSERHACARISAEAANDPPVAQIDEPGEPLPPDPVPPVDLRRQLQQAALRLGHSIRTTFLLWMEEPEITYRELARRTGTRTTTVGTRLLRARRSLRAMPFVAARFAPQRPANDGACAPPDEPPRKAA